MSRPIRGALFLALALLHAAAWSQLKGLVSESERWAHAVSSGRAGDLLSYLIRYPEGVHAEQARELLSQHDSKPVARLTTDTAQCRQLVQDKVRSMLQRPVAAARMALYDFDLSVQDALLAQPSLTFVPKGQTLESARIEDRVTLHLTATRRGGCTVELRWSHGSGLPASCECQPVDPTHDFGPPPIVAGILKDHARMDAGALVCKREFNENPGDDLPAAYLALRVKLGQELVAAWKARQAQGRTLYPTEIDELQGWEEGLPMLAKGYEDGTTRKQEVARLTALPRHQLASFCATYAARIQELMTSLAVHTLMRR